MDTPDGAVQAKKSKAQLKAERREMQEAQRAAKAAGVAKPSKETAKKSGGAHQTSEKQVHVASLQPGDAFVATSNGHSAEMSNARDSFHVAFKKLCENGFGNCGNDIDTDCHLLAGAILEYVSTNVEWPRVVGAGHAAQLEHAIMTQLYWLLCPNETSRSTNHAVYSRLSSSCCTLVRQLLQHIHSVGQREETVNQLVDVVVSFITDFIAVRLQLSAEAISLFARQHIDSCIARRSHVLTYGWSELLQRVLCECLPAHAVSHSTHVCVIDSAPQYNGKRLVRALTSNDIRCSYALLNSMSYVLHGTRLCLLPCKAVLANGDIVAAMGSASIALCARAANIPVIVLAPTHMFNDMISLGATAECEVVAAGFVSGIITELRLLPASSAPAVLRVKQQTV